MAQTLPRKTRPSFMPELAAECLQSLAAQGLGGEVSVGGGVGLLQYLDYRATHDLDMWWSPGATAEIRQRVLDTVESVLKAHGNVRRRQWGDVVSLELFEGTRVVYSFQVAARDVVLTPPVVLEWVNVQSDSIDDLIASKMNALIERGAPRDFRDIHAVCNAGLVRIAECWELWRRRSRASRVEPDTDRAVLAIQTHLSRIARMRPLESITDAARKSEAQALRTWFSESFVRTATEVAP